MMCHQPQESRNTNKFYGKILKSFSQMLKQNKEDEKNRMR